MGATEDAFYEQARSRGLRLERQVGVSGLSSRGHLDPVLAAKASEPNLHRLADIFDQLGGDRAALVAKRSVPLRLDFYVPDRVLFVEVDETQHFTTDRALTLDRFDAGVDGAWIDRYRRLIEEWSKTADRYRAAKPAVDFPRASGRRAQRAYFDAVRDLGAAELGVRLVRIAAPECDAMLAFGRFEAALLES